MRNSNDLRTTATSILQRTSLFGAALLVGSCVLAPSALVAQSSKPSPYQSTPSQGTSQPPSDAVVVNDNAAADTAPAPPPPPAYSNPLAPPARQAYTPPPQQNPADGTDAGIVTGVPEPARSRPDENLRTRPNNDPDAGIVTGVPSRAGEIPEGTTIRVRLDQELSTRFTERGAPFTAHLVEDIRKDGQIVIPSGSVLTGHVARVREGHRLRSSATMSLLPEFISLPDGTRYGLRAQIVGTDKSSGTRTLGEGTIASNDKTKLTVGETAAAAGGGAVIGATFGGPPGAAVGAVVGAGLMTVHLLQQTQQATLPQGTELTFGLTDSLMLTSVQPMQQN